MMIQHKAELIRQDAYEDRWYQIEAVDKTFEYYSNDRPVVNGVPIAKNPLICLPTGTGKGTVIAMFIMRCFQIQSNTRVVMATHVKELIKQNAADLLDFWPMAPLGICSAGLHSYDLASPIIFGGVKTLVKRALDLGYIDFLVIDEAHLLADEGDYQTLINILKVRNPFLKVIGLTATPYRMGLGLMTNGNIFTDIIYNMCNIDGFSRLIAEGFLCPLIPKRTETQLDITGVGIRQGDYVASELEEAVDKTDINAALLSEYVRYSHDRKCGLLFASGVAHATHLWEMLNDTFHQECVILHSKRSETQNDAAIKSWKSGRVKHAVNMNMLTTGVNCPMLDVIGDGQPTCSTGKHVQKYGRATRPYPGKANGLILDFARNTRRLGPINDPVIPRPKGQGSPGDAPVRVCPSCGTYNHASVRTCVVCGLAFDFSPDLSRQASTTEIMRSDLPEIEEFPVENVLYSEFTAKQTGRSWLKIGYKCGLRQFNWIKTIEGKDYPAKQGRDWFRQVYGEPNEDMTNKDVLSMQSYLRPPTKIRVWINKENPSILNQEF
jgi:DNA repair protein RadD